MVSATTDLLATTRLESNLAGGLAKSIWCRCSMPKLVCCHFSFRPRRPRRHSAPPVLVPWIVIFVRAFFVDSLGALAVSFSRTDTEEETALR